MSDDGEYEVETILCARVMKKTPRSKHLTWKYCVKWKGYENPDDNTWEPVESFDDSQHIIEAFWKKVDSGGRNVENLKLFKEGEELSPSESRKSRKPSKQSNEANERDLPSSRSGKRKRNLVEPGEASLSKRSTTRTSKTSRNARLEQSPVDLQDVEDHQISFPENGSSSEKDVTSSERPPRYRKSRNLTPSESPIQPTEQKPLPDMPAERSDTVVQTSITPRVPAHRVRAANPLVKMMDSDINMDSALSTKARLVAGMSGGEPPSRSSQSQERRQIGSPGTTSSAYNGAPALEFPAEPVPAVRSGESLQIAGSDDNAEDLEDYEEDNTESYTTSFDLRTNDGSQSIFQQSLALAKDKLFPATFTTASQSIGNAISAAWKKSTIFGPLASGSYQPQPAVLGAGDLRSQTFILNLDIEISLPVIFITPTSSNSPEPDLVVPMHSDSPPGKFYSQDIALSVLNTLRTGGPCAIVNHDPQCSEKQKNLFSQFSERLSKDELFLAMAGTDVLAFCSSTSLLIFQRLNFPPSLGSSPSAVLVKRVTIQDHSAYATVALQV